MRRATCLMFLIALGLVCSFASFARAEEPAIQEKPPAMPAKEDLENKFEQMMSGVTLIGNFTDRSKPDGKPSQDKYTIDSVKKLAGDYWLITSRIQYGDRDVTLPLPLRVLWAGDTPVITLDSVPVPGFGAFTARVMIYDDHYAGMWSGHDHGGLMYGKIVKAKSE